MPTGRRLLPALLLLLPGTPAAPGPPAVSVLPPGFGRPAYLSDMPPGTWFWSETRQRVYLRLDRGLYADPETGETWEFTPNHHVGWPVRARVGVTRPAGLDLRPWEPPARGG